MSTPVFESAAVLDAGPYMDQHRAIWACERLHAIMAAWHRDEHTGPYVRCQRQPCRDLNRQQQG